MLRPGSYIADPYPAARANPKAKNGHFSNPFLRHFSFSSLARHRNLFRSTARLPLQRESRKGKSDCDRETQRPSKSCRPSGADFPRSREVGMWELPDSQFPRIPVYQNLRDLSTARKGRTAIRFSCYDGKSQLIFGWSALSQNPNCCDTFIARQNSLACRAKTPFSVKGRNSSRLSALRRCRVRSLR
jgi:hypothetical protein